MAKFRRKNIIAFITLTLLFLYLYSCMTGYFIHAMDEEVQLNSILIAGLVFFFLLSFFANRSKITKDRVIFRRLPHKNAAAFLLV